MQEKVSIGNKVHFSIPFPFHVCVGKSFLFLWVTCVPVTPHRRGHMRDPNRIFPHKAFQGPAQFYSSVLHIHRFNPKAKYRANKTPPSQSSHLNQTGRKITHFLKELKMTSRRTTPRPARCRSPKLFL